MLSIILRSTTLSNQVQAVRGGRMEAIDDTVAVDDAVGGGCPARGAFALWC